MQPRRKRTQWKRYVLFALVLALADLATFYAAWPRPVEPKAVVIQEGQELAAYRAHITREFHFLTESGCFQRTDVCSQRVETMITHAKPELTVRKYRQYLFDGIGTLYETGCIKYDAGCEKFAHDIPNQERR